MSVAIPKNLEYMNKNLSAPARAYVANLQPEGATSGYLRNTTCKIQIPTGGNLVMDPLNSYLKFTLDGMVNGANANLLRLDGAGAHGVISRLTVTHGSTEIEDVPNYNMLAKLMMSLQESSDGHSGKMNMLGGTFKGYANSGGNCSVIPLVGEKLTATLPELYDASGNAAVIAGGAAVAKRSYCINLISYVGSLCGDKYIPLFDMGRSNLTLSIQFADSAYKFLCVDEDLANTGAFRIDNVELVASFIELSDDTIATIRASQMGQPLQYVIPRYSNVTQTQELKHNSTTTVSLQVAAPYASLKSILCPLRSRAEGDTRNFFPLASTHHNLTNWRFQIGSLLIPSKSVEGVVESYAELLKSIGILSDLNHEPSLNYVTYAQDAHPLANNETAGSIGTTTRSPCFAIGLDLDLETYSSADKSRIFSGMDTRNSNIYLNATFNQQGGGAHINCRFDFFALYDQVIVFENGDSRIVR